MDSGILKQLLSLAKTQISTMGAAAPPDAVRALEHRTIGFCHLREQCFFKYILYTVQYIFDRDCEKTVYIQIRFLEDIYRFREEITILNQFLVIFI